MRLIIALIIVFTAIVSLGFWTNHQLQLSAGEILQNIEEITLELENGRWDEAYNLTLELETVWDKEAEWWPTVLDHQEMDNIEFSMARAREYVAAKDASLSLGQFSELALMIKHIPEKEAISIKNIL